MARLLKRFIVLSMATLLSASMFSVVGFAQDDAQPTVYVQSQRELINAAKSSSKAEKIILENDITLSKNLVLSKTVVLDMNGHKIVFAPGYCCKIGTCTIDRKTKEYNYVDDISVKIENGTMQGAYGKDGMDGINGYVTQNVLAGAMKNGGKAKDGKSCIEVISGNLFINNSTIMGGNGGNGGNGKRAYASIISTTAGRGGNGGNGGYAILQGRGCVVASKSKIVGGNGGIGGNGGNTDIIVGRASRGGNGGNGAVPVNIVSGTFNAVSGTELIGGKGGSYGNGGLERSIRQSNGSCGHNASAKCVGIYTLDDTCKEIDEVTD